MRFFLLCLPLTGCWVTGPEVRQQIDDITLTAPTTSQPGTPTGTGITTPTATGSPTSTGTTTPTTTTPTLACADEHIGSAVGPTAATGDTTGAEDDLQGTCFGGATGPDLAFGWTAPNDGCFAFDTTSSTHDTVMYLQAGCTPDSLVCNDNIDDASIASSIGYDVTGGTDYVIVVDSLSAETGAFDLGILPTARIVADIDLYSNVGSFTGDNLTADTTMVPGKCDYNSGADVLLSWSAPSSGRWRFSLSGAPEATFDSVLSLHRPCSEDAFICDDYWTALFPYGGENLEADLEAGEQVFIRIGGYQGLTDPVQTGNYQLNITAG
jgi:hypothetical protein